MAWRFAVILREMEQIREHATCLGQRIMDLQQNIDGPSWEIVCPDGNVRHYPYIDRGRAEWDAQVAEDDCQFLGYSQESVLWKYLPTCFGGRHTVRPAEVMR